MRSSTERIFDEVRGEMVGQNEIADHAGVALVTVRKWRTRGLGFPEPATVLAMGPVWWLVDVDVWLADTGRKNDGN